MHEIMLLTSFPETVNQLETLLGILLIFVTFYKHKILFIVALYLIFIGAL